MKKWIQILGVCLGVIVGTTACGESKTAERPAAVETTGVVVETEASNVVETAAADLILTSPPEFRLTDPLSSTFRPFTLQSGNYEWTVVEQGEAQSMVACGMHPLDPVAEQNEKLKVPHYNKIDAVSYAISAVALPDRLLVAQWDDSALGDGETEAEESRTYEDTGMIGLHPGKVYEITATWSQERLEERGFWGVASYSFVTE